MKENGIFDKIANLVVKRPKMIVVIWLAVLLISIGVVITQPSTLSYDMTTMEMKDTPESVIGAEIISDEFYDSGTTSMSTVVVVKYTDLDDQTDFFVAFEHQVDVYFSGKVGVEVTGKDIPDNADNPSYYVALYSMVYPSDINGMDEVQTIRDLVQNAKSEIDITGSFDTYVTGSDAINYDTETSAMNDVKKIDPISILLILVLIGLFFRSFVAAATPPLVVGAAYGIMLCLLVGLGSLMDIFYITPILMLVSMLGAGCDYSIFIISRYKEERKTGKTKEAAIHESVKWAGESVATSGLSVIIGFGVLSFCSFSMISTMGIVLALGIVIALLAALTFIPSILMLTGDRIFYPSKAETYEEGSKAMNGWYGNWSRRGQRYFQSTARHAIKYAKPIVLAAVLITVPMAYIMLEGETSYDMIETMPPGEAKDGVDIIVDTVGGGVLMPTYAVVEFQDSIVASIDDDNKMLYWNDSEKNSALSLLNGMDTKINALDNISTTLSLYSFLELQPLVGGVTLLGWDYNYVVNELLNLGLSQSAAETAADAVMGYAAKIKTDHPGITIGDFPDAYSYLAYESGLVSTNGMYAKTTIIMTDEPMSNRSMESIDEIRGVISGMKADPAYAFMTGAWITGSAAATYDISNIVNSEFTWIELGVIILIFLLLFFVLKSYLTPLRAILTILMSIAWTVGLTHIVFDMILGIPVLWMIPIILLVVCLGLGMDYDILLTTRIRENVIKGMSNDEAITHALEKSGAVITLCGLIMAGTFSTLMLSTTPMLQEFGFALGFAILVDALIVRTYIVPALMHLMGDWNWKGPKWMHKEKKTEAPAEEASE